MIHSVCSPLLKVIEMMNKADPFDETDEKLVGMLASHMSAFMLNLAEGSSSSNYATAKPMKIS